MFVDFLMERFEQHREAAAIVWNGETYAYGWLSSRVREACADFRARGLAAGDVVALEADFSPDAAAAFLALIELGCILVPLHESLVAGKKAEFCETTQVEKKLLSTGRGWEVCDVAAAPADHELLRTLRQAGHPGLVLFSSGSTGKSKAVVHYMVRFLEKYKTPRHGLRMIAFMLFDHIGGINTLLYSLSNGGCLVTLRERTPHKVCEAIERHGVQLLPTSPTFLNLLLLSEAYRAYDLSSLETVTYGSEVMHEHTLKRLREAMPHVKLVQTYGLSEVGILRSKSESSDSLWVKVGGEGVETRIVDGMLQIKSPSAMLGYLNAPSPFTEDGWFMTGDLVETKEEYVRFLGRKSEIINVGGEKVFPAEVESVLQQMEGIAEVAVSGEPSPITGQLVKAVVRLETDEGLSEFRRRMRDFCRGRLETFKIPQKVVLTGAELHNERFKRIRLK